MSDKLKFNFPEANLYLAFIFTLSVVVGYYDLHLGFAAFLMLGYIFFYNMRMIKTKRSGLMVDLKNLSIDMDQAAKQTLLEFPVSMCMVDKDTRISWSNAIFSKMLGVENTIGMRLCEHLPKLDFKLHLSKTGSEVSVADSYKIGSGYYDIRLVKISSASPEKKYIIYFFDVSGQIETMRKYDDLKPAVLCIQVDSYDEMINSTSDEFRPMLQAEVERRIRAFVENKNGIVSKRSGDKFLCMITDADFRKIEEEKFSILDDVREIEFSNTVPVTLSIGAANFDRNLIETYKSAMAELEIALGRGGDQAVCKIDDKTVFYGGKSRAVEKRTRVRARIVAHAIRDLVQNSSNVLIMGHKYPDLDAIGSAMGVHKMCRILKKPSNIILDSSNASVDELYKDIISRKEYRNTFLPHSEALRNVDDNTVLFVLDTHRPSITEMPEIIPKVKKTVLIDHHRRGIEFLQNAAITYHETYTSSTSEMVTELIQYIKEPAVIDAITANALLAGITLDTKNFSFNTGVRTYEAAAYLRRNLADPLQVKMYFRGDYESFVIRANCVQNARIVDGLYAISSYDKELKNASLIAAQIADELLNIQGIMASFVLITGSDGDIHVSARSLENMNVQLIMEKLGGGGHIDTAAAQIREKTVDEAVHIVENAVQEYVKTNVPFVK